VAAMTGIARRSWRAAHGATDGHQAKGLPPLYPNTAEDLEASAMTMG
jgi:hypothetical protein